MAKIVGKVLVSKILFMTLAVAHWPPSELKKGVKALSLFVFSDYLCFWPDCSMTAGSGSDSLSYWSSIVLISETMWLLQPLSWTCCWNFQNYTWHWV